MSKGWIETRGKMQSVKAGFAPFRVYKVEHYVPGRGVEEIYVRATSGEVAKSKVKRATGIPKSQLSARVLVRKGHWVTSGGIRVLA